MVIVLEPTISDVDKRRVATFLTDNDFKIREIASEEGVILGAAGAASIDPREIENMPGVRSVMPISKPYKLASREMQPNDTIIRIGNVKIGGQRITIIAGPCSVESREQIMQTAIAVRKCGAVMLRGGAFKPRTSPYSFQGLGEEGLRYLKEAGEATGMPVVTEIVSPAHVDMMCDYVDMFQIGARNMQNFELLKQVGAINRPVMLKRGPAATIEEWLMAAEYLLAHGAEEVVLCERGIRTFETYTRFSLDISSIPVVKQHTHLPVIVDPSHATGMRDKVAPVALAAIAAGADGLMVEVHPQPDKARSDGPQSIYPEQFERLMRDIEAMTPVVEKELIRLPEFYGTDPSFYGTAGTTPAGTDAPHSQTDRLLIAFQGRRGAYSEIALRRFFQSEESETLPCDDFRSVFAAVLQEQCRYGIVPIENSLSGSIHENYDLLMQFPDVQICGEIRIRIVHSLIGTPDATMEQVTTVLSHPQGLMQCARFLDRHADWQQTPYYDTAGAVAHIAKTGDRQCAAIANSEAAVVYGMRVLKEGIENNPNNYTRFVVLARESAARVDNPDKASIVFSIPDRPGALLTCMQVLAQHHLNLTKLESRPILGKPWEYLFYLDIEIPTPSTPFFDALDELAPYADDMRTLGQYRKR